MQLFVATNIILAILTLVFYIITVFYHRHLLLKPSMAILGFYHIQIQWAGSLNAEYIYNYLPSPTDFMVVLHGFPLIGLLLSGVLFRKDSLVLFKKISVNENKPNSKAIIILTATVTAIVCLYLLAVPLKSTGLYSVFFKPELATSHREESLALLQNMFVKYSYTFLRSVFAPLLVVMVYYSLIENIKKANISKVVLLLCLTLFIFISVMLPGDRSSAAFIILAVLYSIFSKKGFPLKLHVIATTLIIVLFIPVVITILREGRDLELSLMIEYFHTGIFRRVFIVPLETGLWHAHYAQINGFIGIEGIPKLASLYGKEPVNVPGVIYQLYTSALIPTGTANTSYIFTYYSLFGLPSLILSLICLCMLDIVVFIYRFLPTDILLPAIAATFVSSSRFISSDFTTTLLTGGFLVIPIISIVLALIIKIKLKAQV